MYIDAHISFFCFLLTVRFVFAIDGPCVRSVLTMSAWPAHPARCSGELPLSSALLHDDSYVSRSSTMCLKFGQSKEPMYLKT